MEGDDREAPRLQGVRPVVPGGRRGAARARQTRRAAVERGAVLPERGPGRAGGQGVDALIKALRRTRWPSARCFASAPATSSWRSTKGRDLLRDRSRRRSRASRRRGARWATRRRSARGCSSRARRWPTWTRTSASTARAIRRTPPACSSRRGRCTRSRGSPEELRAHLRSYLKVGQTRRARSTDPGALPAGRAGLEGVVRARSDDGACLHVDRMTASRSLQVIEAANQKLGRRKQTQCGPATKSKIVLYDRSRPQAAAAEEHFRAAINLWKAGDAANPIAGRDAEARGAAAYAAAGAAFYLAEKDYEDLLRVKFPGSLDFSQPSRARQPAAARGRAEEAGRFEEAVQRVPRREGEGAGRGAQPLPGGVQAAPGAVDDRGGGARRPALPGLRRPALHGGDPQGPAGHRRVGQPPAR